jgi:hypothetical protein
MEEQLALIPLVHYQLFWQGKAMGDRIDICIAWKMKLRNIHLDPFL